MARKTREEKLQERIDHLENILESFESPSMAHIKNLYFTSEADVKLGKYYLFCHELKGKKYLRLGLERVDIENGDTEPAAKEIAGYGNDGGVTAKYAKPQNAGMDIVKTMSKTEAVKYYEKALSESKAELEDMYEPRQLKKAGQIEKALKGKA